MTKRDLSIIKMRKDGASYKDIGKSFKLTPERTRQVVENINRVFCLEHETSYIGLCHFCILEKDFANKLNTYTVDAILSSIIPSLLTPNRTKKFVIMRQLTIRALRDNHRLSYRSIGKLLKRHHSTIINLYKA